MCTLEVEAKPCALAPSQGAESALSALAPSQGAESALAQSQGAESAEGATIVISTPSLRFSANMLSLHEV